MAKIVAVTARPTGIAQTTMVAEGLEQAAKALGHQIQIEMQGSAGARNALSNADIAAADVVIIANAAQVDATRFAGKPIYATTTEPAIQDSGAVIEAALAELASQHTASAAETEDLIGAEMSLVTEAANQDAATRRTEPVRPDPIQRTAPHANACRHLTAGVSNMIPFVVGGGLLIVLGFVLGGSQVGDGARQGTLGWTLFQIGSLGFALIPSILAGFIAYSIADRPGVAPGMIGGMIASTVGAGFLGGIAAGFLAGHSVRWLDNHIRLPDALAGLKPVLILPLLGALIVGLLMHYAVGGPVAATQAALTAWLKGLHDSGALALGLLLGAMMAFDLGGPVSKSAAAFAAGLIASQVYQPMAAVMAAGMTPSLGLALAAALFKDRFSSDERAAGGAVAVLGLSFITEGALPGAAKDPLRVIPALMVGSAVAGAISMVFGCELRAPHGGVFVLFAPGVATNLVPYLFAIVAGTLVTAGALLLFKRPVAVEP